MLSFLSLSFFCFVFVFIFFKKKPRVRLSALVSQKGLGVYLHIGQSTQSPTQPPYEKLLRTLDAAPTQRCTSKQKRCRTAKKDLNNPPKRGVPSREPHSDTFVAGACPTTTEASRQDAVDGDGDGRTAGKERCHWAKSYHSPQEDQCPYS